MDTSLSKALIIVAGVLLAMIVIAFITFSFRRIGTWATTSDQQLLTEQKDKFNKEYEVYDKSLMYGVDVISCLNKVLSNNEKITNGAIVNGEKYDESYEVKVKFTIKKPLQESITVYHMGNDEADNYDGKEYAYANTKGPAGPYDTKLESVGFNFFEKGYKDFTKFNKNSNLQSKEGQDCNVTATGFELTAQLNGSNGSNEDNLRDLLSVSNELSEIVKNPDKTNSSKKDSWTKAEFRSALYDLKTRKFKCVKIGYSEAGRVNYIEFKEI